MHDSSVEYQDLITLYGSDDVLEYPSPLLVFLLHPRRPEVRRGTFRLFQRTVKDVSVLFRSAANFSKRKRGKMKVELKT
jgi:hypothetical protein